MLGKGCYAIWPLTLPRRIDRRAKIPAGVRERRVVQQGSRNASSAACSSLPDGCRPACLLAAFAILAAIAAKSSASYEKPP
jgi:hypothetical protein